MSTMRRVAAILCCMYAVAAPSCAVAEIALAFSDGSEESVQRCTGGWAFTVSSPIVVTHLGLYATSAGLVHSHNIGIWEDNGALLATGTVTPGSGAGWHWISISSTTLVAGNYVIGAEYHYDDSSPSLPDPDTGYIYATHSTGSGITYVEGRIGFPGFSRPDEASFDDGLFGPNFQYHSPSSVPEPALLQLPFFIVAGSAGLWWKTRGRQTRV